MKKLKVLHLSKGEQLKIVGGTTCSNGSCRVSDCKCTGWFVSNHAWTEKDASKETEMSRGTGTYSNQNNPGYGSEY